jgi:hypothetical protein
MRCPSCAFRDSAIYDSRPIRDAIDGVWRRRRCLGCDHRWTTYERNTAEIHDDVTLDQAVNCLRQLLDAIEQGIDVDDLSDHPAIMIARRSARKILRRA